MKGSKWSRDALVALNVASPDRTGFFSADVADERGCRTK
jgi:hypothetical protein